MGLKEQITRVIHNDLRLQKDIAEASGVNPTTIKKMQVNPEHTTVGLLMDVLNECGHTLKVVKKDDGIWHDLRKNPEDLPEEGMNVLAWMHPENNDKGFLLNTRAWFVREGARESHAKVIAWREADYFEED